MTWFSLNVNVLSFVSYPSALVLRVNFNDTKQACLYYLFDILLISSAFAGNPSLLCLAYVITQAYIKDRNQCWSSPATNNFPYSKSLVSSSSPSAPLSLLPVLFSDICDPKDPWELNRLSEVWEPSLTTSSRVGWWAEWRSFWNAYQELKHFPIKKSAVKMVSLCLHLSPNSPSYVNHVGLIFTTNRQLQLQRISEHTI